MEAFVGQEWQWLPGTAGLSISIGDYLVEYGMFRKSRVHARGLPNCPSLFVWSVVIWGSWWPLVGSIAIRLVPLLGKDTVRSKDEPQTTPRF